MKNNKGITLIALVITIIVLLILAGVTIAMLTGDNGILNRANEAKYDDIVGKYDEQVKLVQLGLRTSITANMQNKAGYIATDPTNFSALVTEVTKQLNNVTVNTKATNNEGYSVYQYLKKGTTSINGTGYILITYSSNAFRSSLPSTLAPANAGTWNVAGGMSYDASIKANTTFSRNQAVLAHVIKVSNYKCELSNGILTTTDSETDSTTGVFSTAATLSTTDTATTFLTKTIGTTVATALPVNVNSTN